MGKPSITNIQPPSKTGVWTPPKTTWDLNGADWATAEGLGWAADSGDSGFDALTDKVNVPPPDTVDMGDLGSYDYIFFGVNGGENETVIGKTNAKGVIVTGNGMDTITGGGLDDLVFSGNGKDIAHGGAGDDILFGENGADQLFGDSDNGTASATTGSVVDDEGNPVTVWDHDPTSDDYDVPGSGDVAGHLKKAGIWIDGDGNVHQVFQYTTGLTGDGTTGPFTGAFYDGNVQDTDVEAPLTAVMHLDFSAENTVYYFSFQDDDGGFFALFNGFIADEDVPTKKAPLPDDLHIATSQAYGAAGDYVITEGGLTFDGGDQLIGGHGPDTFTYDVGEGPKNVDIIWDFNQSTDDVYDAAEGDTLVLKGVTDLSTATIFTDVDIDGEGSTGLVIYFGPDHAIGLVGITDISQVAIQYG